MTRSLLRALCALLALGLARASPAGPEAPPPAWDPLEQQNRDVFFANDKFDRWLLEPVAKGWEFITPLQVRLAVDRFYINLEVLVRVVGTLGQGRVVDAGEELLRFGVNTTIGVAGFFDPATRFGIDLHDEDFGQLLAKWRIPRGPYLVLPFYNASTGRDAFGFLVDFALVPTYLLPGYGLGLGTIKTINDRALALDDVRVARQASLDFYGFVRSAYLERRWQQIHDTPAGGSAPGTDDDLYEIEEDAP